MYTYTPKMATNISDDSAPVALDPGRVGDRPGLDLVWSLTSMDTLGLALNHEPSSTQQGWSRSIQFMLLESNISLGNSKRTRSDFKDLSYQASGDPGQ
jgi:hypothetical protein